MPSNIAQIQAKIQKVKEELMSIGDMRPGSLSEQYNVCGTAGCQCKDPKNPKRHGPYYQLNYSYEGRSRTEFVKKEMVTEVCEQIRNYAKFRTLTKQWIVLSLQIAKLKKAQGA